jgi:hypothetical protein
LHHGAVAPDADVSTTSVLSILRDPAAPEDLRRQAVLEAEVLEFGDHLGVELADALLPLFWQLVRDQSTDALVATCSALRTIVAYLPPERLEELAPLLEADTRQPVALEVELECAKVLVRRLTYSQAPPLAATPGLRAGLRDVATTYLRPRLIARRWVSATALNAVLALVLLHDPSLTAISDDLRKLDAKWFLELVQRRLADLAVEASDENQDAQRIALEAFADRLRLT